MAIKDEILAKAKEYRDYTAKTLSEMVKIRSYDGEEEAVCRKIVEMCEEAGFDEVRIDGLGSVVGRVGNGPKSIAFDAHIDTVEVGDPSQWSFDPFSGEIKDGLVHGRGSSDQKGGAASM
ncbi:MAG: M20/M25/M40 family metallo-hydrolase, partial [Spirochaetia bacterium]